MATVAAPTVFNPSNQMVNEDPAVKKEADKNTESVISGVSILGTSTSSCTSLFAHVVINSLILSLTRSNFIDIIEDRREDSEGRIVSAKYVKGNLLGKGGFAECFVGHLLPSKAPYALKIVAKSSVTKSR